MSELVKGASIDIVSVSSRAKDLDSAVQKITRKGYTKPEDEMTDLAGVRVITYVETDVPRVAQLVERAFHVVPEKSSDKTEDLGVDRSGYRSLHYVCDLGADRLKLPEFEGFREVLFEIQIRTALQHAWAEIEHDRRYKFSGVLPKLLQRRLNLLAGMLEIADREFAAVAAEVDAYAREVTRATLAGQLDVEINSTSVLSFLTERLKGLRKTEMVTGEAEPVPTIVIEELAAFGIRTLKDLSQIVDESFVSALDNTETQATYIGVLRDAMMYADIDRYFAVAWQNHWQGIDEDGIGLLADKYGSDRIREIIISFKLDMM